MFIALLVLVLLWPGGRKLLLLLLLLLLLRDGGKLCLVAHLAPHLRADLIARLECERTDRRHCAVSIQDDAEDIRVEVDHL